MTGENEIDGPRIGQRLEDAEIPVALVRKQPAQIAQLLRRMAQLPAGYCDPGHRAPVGLLTGCALTKPDFPGKKHLVQFLPEAAGLAERFEQIVRASVFSDQAKGPQGLRRLTLQLNRLPALVHIDVEELNRQHCIMRHNSAAAFGNQRRVRHLAFIGNPSHGIDQCMTVLFDRVIRAGRPDRSRSIVVDSEAATQVQ